MSSANSQNSSRSSGSLLHTLSVMITGSITTAALILGFGLWRGGDKFWNIVNALLTAPADAPQVDVKSIVVQQVRGASELTTAIFAMQAVVPTKRDRTFAGQTIGSTTLLYIGYGEVRAGVDLSQIQPADVQVSGTTINLRLPPPRLLDSKIDVNRSSVYDYDRGFLGLGPDAAPELQQQAQRQTLQSIVEAACSQGILQEANERAKLAVTQLLTTAGYPTATVETQPPASDACPTSAKSLPNPVPLPSSAPQTFTPQG